MKGLKPPISLLKNENVYLYREEKSDYNPMGGIKIGKISKCYKTYEMGPRAKKMV